MTVPPLDEQQQDAWDEMPKNEYGRIVFPFSEYDSDEDDDDSAYEANESSPDVDNLQIDDDGVGEEDEVDDDNVGARLTEAEFNRILDGHYNAGRSAEANDLFKSKYVDFHHKVSMTKQREFVERS